MNKLITLILSFLLGFFVVQAVKAEESSKVDLAYDKLWFQQSVVSGEVVFVSLFDSCKFNHLMNWLFHAMYVDESVELRVSADWNKSAIIHIPNLKIEVNNDREFGGIYNLGDKKAKSGCLPKSASK